MRLSELVKRNFKEVVRDRVTLAFLVGMPVAFMLIFGFAFGDMGAEPIPLGVVDQDETPISEQFINEALSPLPTLDVSTYGDEPSAREALRVGDVSGILIIPDGFREQFERGEISLNIVYSEAELGVKERLVPIINSAAVAFYGEVYPGKVTPDVHLAATPGEAAGIGFMNFFAPGMMVFGLLILIPTSASLIARDKETGMLSRLSTTPLRPWEFISGYSIPYIPVLILQIAIYLGVAYGLGLKILGNFGLAFLIFLLLGLSAIAMGMILGSFIKQEAQAHIAWVFIVPMAMLSGAWFPTEGMAQVMLDIAKILPSTYAIPAARDIISRGLGFGAIANDFYILFGFAAALFIIGAIAFRRRIVI